MPAAPTRVGRRGGWRGTELRKDFVLPRSPVLPQRLPVGRQEQGLGPESEDSYISSSRPYWAFEGRR